MLNMCSIYSTSYREGTVINASARDGTGKGIMNSVQDARAVGRAILANTNTYSKCIDAALVKGLSEFQQEYSSPKFADLRRADIEPVTEDDVQARFDPGLIIDFPRIRIAGNGCKFSIRTCLTVCLGGTQSKIWTRVVALDTATHRAMPDAELEEFHSLASGWAAAVNEQVRAQYEIDFAAAIDREVDLNDQGRIHLFAVDCEGPTISDAIEDTFLELVWARAESKSLDNFEIADVLRTITKISMPPAGLDQTDSQEFVLSSDASLFPFRASNGMGSLFVSMTNENNAFMSGIVDSARTDIGLNEHGFYDYAYSTGTTAELASFVGSSY
ncbi:MAG: hypothetical protein GY743_03625 [Planctomycetaceae bacterium]|nr:hypothetical protein [Planctomycetaceae bacterium]